jgi:putative membrane protein
MKGILILASCALWLVGCGQQTSDTGATGSESTADTSAEEAKKSAKLADKDLAFMKEAARGGLAEVKMGELGLSNAESQAVKDFSRRLVDDHTKANRTWKNSPSGKASPCPTA